MWLRNILILKIHRSFWLNRNIITPDFLIIVSILAHLLTGSGNHQHYFIFSIALIIYRLKVNNLLGAIK